MSKLMKVSFRVLDLMVVFTMIFGLPMSALAAPAAPAVTIPSTFFTVTDQQGANDVPGQVDMTQMGRDDSDPNMFKLFWSWDSVDFTSQTGDACALFDYNGNGNVDAVVCGQIQNAPNVWTAQNPVIWQTTNVPNSFPNGWTTGGSPFVFRCVDSANDRCDQPSDPQPYVRYTDVTPGTLGSLNVSPTANLVTDTDPFFSDPVPPDSGQGDYYPNDSTLQVNILKSYLQTLAGNLGNKYPAITNPTPTLVNVCSYPSAGSGGNNNPFDCIVTPGGGFLKIDKDAGIDTTTQFNFTVNPGSISKSVTGTGTTGAFPMPVGTAYSVAETLVTGWDLTNAVCKLEDGTTVTGTKSGNTISGITVQSGKITTCTFTNVKQVPQLTLVKTASPTTYSAVSNVISYSYLVTNSGNVKLAGPVTVADDKATVTCPAVTTVGNLDSFLDPNESITCTASYTIQQADINAGSVTNTATASAGGTNSNQDSETVTATQTKSLLLDKTATPTTYAAVGDVISYSYVVTNNGNVSLAGPVTVADDKATVTCPDVNTVGNLDSFLDPNESITCTASYTITQADLDSGSVTNTAKASANGTDSNEDSEIVTAEQTKSLSLVKTASPSTYAAVGDVISYSYVVTNSGNVTFAGPVTVTDDKATVTCPAGGLAPGASTTCTASYTIQQADLDSGLVKNTAQAHANGTDSNFDDETVTAVQSPALLLVKTASPSTYSAVGDVISYSYEVTNTGNVTFAGPVTVADNKATVTCPAGGLAPGASMTCTASYTVTQADIDSGSVTNTAKASANGTDSNEDSETVTAVQSPALSLVKAATPATYDAVGDTISYSYLVTNTGNVTFAGPVTVADNKATVTCPAGGLAPAAFMTCTASYSISQADIDSGLVKNTAQAHANGTNSNFDDETVTAIQSPALNVVKTVTSTGPYDSVGDVITYDITVTNTGNQTLTGVTVTDPGIGAVLGTCTPAIPATLAPTEAVTCSATHSLTQGDIDAGFYTNVATGDSDQTGEDTDDETVPVEQLPALNVVKTVTSTGPYESVGDVISYDITVTNTGNQTLTGVTVTDPGIGAVLGTCTPAIPATLAPTESVTCSASHEVTQGDIDAGFYTNVATGDSDQTGEDTDDETVPVEQLPALNVVKTVTSTGPYDSVGDLITYDITVTNSGNQTLTGVTVTDPGIGAVLGTCTPAIPATLAPTESVTCSATHSLTQGDIDAGSYTNVATGDSDQTGEDTDEETVPVTQSPALSLVKTATPATYDSVGDTIAYSYLLTNTGNVTLSGPFTVADDKASVTCPNTVTLAPLGTITCSATYAITQTDLDSGSVTNIAKGKGSFNGNDVFSNEDKETVTAVQSPALSLVKTATPATYDSVGDTISYSYLLTNTGNVTLSGPFTVADDKATVTCPATATLAPLGTITCTATYSILQSDLDSGSVTNTAKGKGSFNNNDVFSNEDSETVTAVQSPAITLTKSANPTLYSKVGDVITYTYVIKNTGNVTLPGPFTISDDKLGTVTCPTGSLAPLATRTCTTTYTITAADMTVLSITNKATASTIFNGNTVTSNQAQATIYRQTGALLPTQTTCQQYAAGPSAWPTMYDAFTYQVKSNKINSVSPGVIFYYNTIVAPSASFTLTVVETNSLNWRPMFIQDLGQAILYNANCNKASGVTVSAGGNPYTVTFTVTGATAGAIYYIGIKYSPQNLIGQSVKQPYPTSIYSWSTTGFNGSTASIPVKYKK